MTARYQTDFNQWALEQAALLKAHQLEALDLDNLAEEIEDLSRRDRHAVFNQLRRLLEHLLKLYCQPDHRNTSWYASIDDARVQIQQLLEASPSLQHYPLDILADAYAKASRLVSKNNQRLRAAGLQITLDPPMTCLWTIEQVLDESFYG